MTGQNTGHTVGRKPLIPKWTERQELQQSLLEVQQWRIPGNKWRPKESPGMAAAALYGQRLLIEEYETNNPEFFYFRHIHFEIKLRDSPGAHGSFIPSLEFSGKAQGGI